MTRMRTNGTNELVSKERYMCHSFSFVTFVFFLVYEVRPT